MMCFPMALSARRNSHRPPCSAADSLPEAAMTGGHKRLHLEHGHSSRATSPVVTRPRPSGGSSAATPRKVRCRMMQPPNHQPEPWRRAENAREVRTESAPPKGQQIKAPLTAGDRELPGHRFELGHLSRPGQRGVGLGIAIGVAVFLAEWLGLALRPPN